MANNMVYSRLGSTGLRVSKLAYGAWVTFGTSIQTPQAYEIMKYAFSQGINFFDNAEGYGMGKAEIIMGEAIKLGLAEGTWTREDLVITTKIFFGREGQNTRGLSRKHIIEGTKASLRRFQLDYVDVIFAHRPDPTVPIEETVRAFNYVIDQGWAFYWGTSEWDAREITEARQVADRLGLIAPCCEQPQYNLFERKRVEIEYDPLYDHPQGLGLTIWSPLASGVLTGKYSNLQVPESSRLSLEDYEWLKKKKLEQKPEQIDAADKLLPVAQRLECSLAQLAIAWCVANKRVSTVLLGASKLEQLVENVKALEIVPKLTPEVLAEIDAIVGTKPAIDAVHDLALSYRGPVH